MFTIKDNNFKDLTATQIDQIISFEKSSLGLIDAGWEMLVNFPELKPRPYYVLLSFILGINFEEFYNDEANKTESVKQNLSEKYSTWYIGDVLYRNFYTHLLSDTFNFEQMVIDIKDDYASFISNKTKSNVNYVDSGIVINGKTAYFKEEA